MFAKDDCSYDRYRKLLMDITGVKCRDGKTKYCDYWDVVRDERSEYIVLRHDIEFSIDRAFNLSRIESVMGVCSSWFVQVTNNAYNPFSGKNVELLRDMDRRGHHIGLHYHIGKSCDVETVKNDIVWQSDMLEDTIGIHVDRFSFHRPPEELLRADMCVEGYINTYGHDFFTYTDDLSGRMDVKYIADSNHQWKYGMPSIDTLVNCGKVQLLVHPLSWTLEGSDHLKTFQDIVAEKHDEFVATVENEWKFFDQLRGKL